MIWINKIIENFTIRYSVIISVISKKKKTFEIKINNKMKTR